MEEDLGKITERILSSYETGGGMNNIDGSNLPSKRALASICEDLLQLLFPGFHDQEPIHSIHLRRVTHHAPCDGFGAVAARPRGRGRSAISAPRVKTVW